MRFAFPLLAVLVLCIASRIAPAQQRVEPVVELETVESSAQAPRRSAFGRVMDVMIGALMEQHAAQHARAGAASLATRLDAAPAPAENSRRHGRAHKASGRAAEPRIRVSLGERFSLPPADAVTRADLPD
jgi:hypothetical protein